LETYSLFYSRCGDFEEKTEETETKWTGGDSLKENQ